MFGPHKVVWMFQVTVKSVPFSFMWLFVDFRVPFCESMCFFQKFIFLMSSRDVRPVLYCLVPRRCTSETKYCVLALQKFYSIFYSICRFLGIIAERVILHTA